MSGRIAHVVVIALGARAGNRAAQRQLCHGEPEPEAENGYVSDCDIVASTLKCTGRTELRPRRVGSSFVVRRSSLPEATSTGRRICGVIKSQCGTSDQCNELGKGIPGREEALEEQAPEGTLHLHAIDEERCVDRFGNVLDDTASGQVNKVTSNARRGTHI